MNKNLLLKGLPPMHPGEHLREEILPALGKSKAEIARLLGVSRQTLYDVLNEKQPITANLALRIGKLVGGGAEIWVVVQFELRTQTIFDWPSAVRQDWDEDGPKASQ